MSVQAKNLSFGVKLIIEASTLVGQLLISLLLTIISLVITFYVSKLPFGTPFNDNSHFVSFGYSLAAILALASTISFAFLLYFIQTTVSKKNDLYFRIKESVVRLENILYSTSDDLDSKFTSSEDILFSLKMKTLKDLPLKNWKELSEQVIKDAENHSGYDEYMKFTDILDQLIFIEELFNELNLVRIREMISGVFLSTVKKSFTVLAILIFIILASIVHYVSYSMTIYFALTLFLGFFTALLFVEIAWYIHRDVEEMSQEAELFFQDIHIKQPNVGTEQANKLRD